MRARNIWLALCLCGCGLTPGPRLEKTLPVAKIAALEKSPDDSGWALGSDEGEVRLLDPAGQSMAAPPRLNGIVRQLAFNPGRLAYSSALTPIVHVWEPAKKQELMAWAAGDLGREATRIEHHALVWVDSQTGQESDTSIAYVGGREAGQINHLQWLGPDRLLVNDLRGVLSCWDLTHHSRFAQIRPPHPRGRYGFDVVQACRDGTRVATAQYGGGGVEVFELPGGRSLFRDDQLNNVQALEFSPDGAYLACAAGSKVHLIQLQAGVEAVAWDCAGRRLHFSPDGKWLAAAANRSYVWEVASQKQILQTGSCQDLVWLGSRPQVVALYEHGTDLHDLVSGKRTELKGDFYRASASSDGKKLWLASKDEVQLWSLPQP
ncbi:MAG: WD40 repeat domain-containing protein [Vulcanimicrobiota bacterium]